MLVSSPPQPLRAHAAGHFPSYQCALLMLVLVAHLAESAIATPMRVRARSSLDAKVIRDSNGIRLLGDLSDEEGGGVPEREVHVTVDGMVPQVITTDTAGAFDVRLQPKHLAALSESIGRYLAWSIAFDGDGTYGSSTATGRIDLLREATWLQIQATPSAPRVGTDEIRLGVSLFSGSDPVGNVPLQLQIDDGPVLSGQTTELGVATFLVRSTHRRQAGPMQVVAKFEGSSRHDRATAKKTIHLSFGTRTTLRIGREGPAASGRYRFSGRVSTHRGPVRQATVNVVARGKQRERAEGEPETSSRIILVASTDSEGRYLGALPAQDLFADFEDLVDIYAMTAPDVAQYSASKSRAVEVSVPRGYQVPTHWYGWALGWVFGLLTVVQAIRMQALSHLVGWFRRWLARRKRGPLLGDVGEFIELNVDPTNPGRGNWLRGAVLDRHAGIPLSGATVSVTAEGGRCLSAKTDACGDFDLGAIDSGRWTLVLSRPGYQNDSSRVRFPHGGGLDGARLMLVSDRHHARIAFGKELRKLGHTWRWGYDTIREAVARVSGTDSRQDELSAEGALLEATWYKSPPPSSSEGHETGNGPEKEV